MTSSHRIALSDPRACRTPFPFDHLSLGEIAELSRARRAIDAGESGPTLFRRFAELSLREYTPPGIPETPEAA